MAESRLNVLPSRMVLTQLKERVAAARTGWDLLKRKSDAIKVQLNNILKKILALKRRVGQSLKDAAFSHTEAQWAAGNFNAQVIENTKESSYRIKTKVNNVAGVKLPIFERSASSAGSQLMVGLSKGGQQIAKCKESFTKTLDDLIQLASLQTSLKTLDDALKVTNRRVNALEFVIMPMLNNTIKYVISELDELEREDQYRIKKVKDIRTVNEEEEAAQLREALKKLQAGGRDMLELKSASASSGVIPARKAMAVDMLFDAEEKASADDGVGETSDNVGAVHDMINITQTISTLDLSQRDTSDEQHQDEEEEEEEEEQ